MASKTDDSPPGEGAWSAFAVILAALLRDGVRPVSSGKRWGIKEFASATGKTDKTVRNWLNGHPCSDIDSIERALFGTNMGLQRKQLSDAHFAAKHRKDISPPSKVGAQNKASEIEIREEKKKLSQQYEAHLRAEFRRIHNRVENVNKPRTSTSRVKILGWLYCCALADPRLFAWGIEKRPKFDARISAVELKIKHRSLLHSQFGPKMSRKKTFVTNLVSFRYLLYCHCVALGIKDFNSSFLYEPFLQGMRERWVDESHAELVEIIETMISDPRKDAIPTRCTRILQMVGALASKVSVDLEDLFTEESHPDRSGIQKKNQTELEDEASITHKIEIYFSDERGKWARILHHLSRDVTLNLQRTITETQSPERVAKATLLVSYHGPQNLDERIKKFAERLDGIIFETFVTDLPG